MLRMGTDERCCILYLYLYIYIYIYIASFVIAVRTSMKIFFIGLVCTVELVRYDDIKQHARGNTLNVRSKAGAVLVVRTPLDDSSMIDR